MMNVRYKGVPKITSLLFPFWAGRVFYYDAYPAFDEREYSGFGLFQFACEIQITKIAGLVLLSFFSLHTCFPC